MTKILSREKEFPKLAPQSPKYTIHSLFEGATKLEDIFPRK